MTVTPITTPYGPVAFVQIGEVLYPLNLLTDAAGNDVLGTADASPDPHTLLGRLKTMNDLLAQLVQLGGGTPGGGGSTAPSMDFSQPGNSQYLGG